MNSGTPESSTDDGRRDLRFVILGAGMAGLLSAIKLKRAGFENFAVYEKADRLGGTWRENTYPGLTCDVPSHLYSYSFAPNPEWSQRFAPGSEIQAYFEDVARRFEVDSQIHFGKEITRCTFEGGRWRIEAADGTTDTADIVIAATGVLHHPSYPDFEGMDSFQGPAFHSARWNHDVSLKGKRVGIVGNGSTAIQIIAALVDDVSELTLFQRTPQWVMPADNPAYTDADRLNFRTHPEEMEAVREDIRRAFTDGFANVLVDADSPILAAIHDMCEANLENSVKDPELKEKLRPNYRAACKRLIMSPNFYDAIQRPNANVVTEGVDRIERNGVRTRDGQLHELDALILATGFRVDQFMRPMEVFGRDGLDLEDTWQDAPSAYMAISLPDFPNFFMLNGPNGPVGNFSLIDVAELQFDYIMQLVDQIRAGRCTEVSVSRSASDRFDEERREAAKTTIWNSGCKSWYLDASGLPTAWPWTFDRFKEEMATPKLEDYQMK
jgi:cation diffusion facilitator CzcD-associated flavoprotein CzcO